MANRKRSVMLFSLLVLTAVIISACTRPYSNVELETAVPEETSLFVEPFPTSDNPMAMVENLSTGTALAETAAALTAGTPLATEVVTETTPDSNATATATLDTSVIPSATSTLGNVAPSATQPAAPSPSGNTSGNISRPGSYTLQKGEFPYCIARRFNLDPAELLSLNSLANGDIYYPNLTLTIPQSGKPFPGTRALRSHPDTYTVADASLTVSAVACVYGDVDPASIVSANSGVTLTSPLTAGQTLTIP